MAEHSTLPDSELHEPKGVANANADEVYGADGVGSGDWKKIYTVGFEDYNDSGSSQGLDTSYTDLTNDGAGSNTLKTYQLPGFNDIWDTSNNQFDWDAAGLSLGDVVQIRFDLEVTTAGANSELILAVDMAHGDASEYELVVEEVTYKASGTYQLVTNLMVYMGNIETLSNPAKVKMKSDNASDSVVVNGWSVYVFPRNPVLS